MVSFNQPPHTIGKAGHTSKHFPSGEGWPQSAACIIFGQSEFPSLSAHYSNMTRRSWRSPFLVLLSGTIVLLLGMGARMTFGLWLAPASTGLGWDVGVLSGAMALQALMWGIGTPFAGMVADKYGAGRVVAFAGLCYASGLILMSQATSPIHAYIGIGILVGFAMSAGMYPLILTVVSRTFTDDKRRAVAVGIASAGGSSGMFVMVLPAETIIAAYDWATMLMVMAAFTALLLPLSVVLAGRNPAAVGEAGRQPIGQALREATAHKGYLLLTAGYFVCGFQTLFIADHFPNMLRGYNFSPEMGATAISLIGLFNILGSFVWGTMGGWVRKKYLLCWLYTLRSIAMIVFILLPVTQMSVVIFACVMGVLWLGTVPLTGAIVGQIFGFRYMSMLFGVCFVSHQLGSFLGVWAGGVLYDLQGNYTVIWWVAIALGFIASLLHFPINDRPLARLAKPSAA